MDEREKADCLIKWISVLQEGKVRPDKDSRHPYVRDAIDNLKYINGANYRLSQMLDAPPMESDRY